MKKLLLVPAFVLFIMSNIIGQDDGRISVNLGYGSKLASHEVFGIPNEHSLIKLGVEKSVRYYRNMVFFFGGEISLVNVTVPPTGGFFNPSVPGFEDKVSVAGFYFGGKREYFEGLFYSSAAVLVEYDFGGSDAYAYARQNGVGVFFLLGKDIHLNDTYVLSIEPGVRARSGLQFSGNKGGGIGGESNHSVIFDLHFNIGVGYKFF